MGHSTSVPDYIGSGLLANRASVPNIVNTCGSVFFATDVKSASIWDGGGTKWWDLALTDNLVMKPTANVATTAALATNTYSNGTAGVGATITINATGTLTIDGHLTILGDVVLVKDEAAGSHNGLYVVTTAGAGGVSAVLTRHTAMNATAQFLGAVVPVEGGAANGYTFWGTGFAAITVGTTSVVFTEMGGAGGSGSLAVGTSTITSGTTGRILYDNGAILGEYAIGAKLSTAGGTLDAPGVGTLTVGSGIIASGTTGRLLYDNGGTLGEYVFGSNISSSSGTINVTGVGTLTVGTALISGGTNTRILFDNSGTLGEYVLGTNLSVSSGTLNVATGAGGVTSVVAGTGLSGGTITSTGTVALAAIAAGNFLANTTTASAAPVATALGSIVAGTGLSGGPFTAASGGTLANTGVLAVASGAGLTWSGSLASETISFATIATHKFLGNTGALPAVPTAITFGTITAGTGLSGGPFDPATGGTIAIVAATTAALGGIIAGSGVTINAGGTVSVAPGGVTNIGTDTGAIVVGAGLSEASNTLSNTGVLALSAGSGIVVTGSAANETISVTGGLLSGSFMIAMAALSAGTELGAL